MMKKKIIVIVTMFIVLGWTYPMYGQKTQGTDEPVTISADRLDVYEGKNLVVFSGNVDASQKGIHMTSDTLKVYYQDNDSAGKTRAVVKGGKVDRIVAKGNVVVVQAEKRMTGDEAVYYYDEEKIVVTGKTKIQEGKNIITGGTITFFIDEKKGTVECSNNARVKATIYPKNKVQEGNESLR